jgi:Fe2+ or Zn2+ uptake regulation protein
MNSAVDQLHAVLKQDGHSLTTPRLVVFEALEGQEPQTMAQLVASCQAQIDRASVYRTTSLFEQLGIVQRLQIGWKYKLELSDNFQSHHHHITCTNCAATVPIPEDAHLESHLNAAATAAGFTISGHQVEIQGLCAACAQRLGV